MSGNVVFDMHVDRKYACKVFWMLYVRWQMQICLRLGDDGRLIEHVQDQCKYIIMFLKE